MQMYSKNYKRNPMPEFFQLFPEIHVYLTGEKWRKPRPEGSLLKQALMFANATGAITDKHKKLLEEMENGTDN